MKRLKIVKARLGIICFSQLSNHHGKIKSQSPCQSSCEWKASHVNEGCKWITLGYLSKLKGVDILNVSIFK